MIDRVAEAMGRIDILVNNAGTGDLRPLHTVDDKLWHRLIDVNLTGTFNATRAAIPYMLELGRGAIVNNASVSGLMPTRNEAAYSAAKAGVISLTKSGALEYGPTVRVELRRARPRAHADDRGMGADARRVRADRRDHPAPAYR